MSRRGVTILGLAVAGGAGYYLYSAGGDPKVAEKKMEADAHKLSAKVKSEIPGREKQAEAKGEELAQRAGSKADELSRDAKSALSDAKSKAQEYQSKAGTELKQAADTFDKKVSEGTEKAKSGISSWFGGK